MTLRKKEAKVVLGPLSWVVSNCRLMNYSLAQVQRGSAGRWKAQNRESMGWRAALQAPVRDNSPNKVFPHTSDGPSSFFFTCSMGHFERGGLPCHTFFASLLGFASSTFFSPTDKAVW